jgi:protein TonB
VSRPAGESHQRLINYRVQGWAVSAVTHALAVGAAFALTSTLHLLPQPEPFKWKVSLVQPPAPQVVEPPQPDPTPPKPQRMEPSVVETKPVVQEVQAMAHVVRQEIREVTPEIRNAVRTTVQPAPQIVTHTMESVNQTAQTELAAVQTVAATEARRVVTEPATVVKPATVVQEEAPVVREEVPGTVHAITQATPSPLVAATAAPVSRQAVEREPVAAIQTAAVSEKSVEPVQTGAIQERQVVSEPVSAMTTEPAPIQQASIRQVPVQPLPATKADYSWLAEALWNRVEQLKRYPHLARMNRWEGMVVLQAVIRHDGQLVDLKVAESSGHAVLDQDAMEVMRKACPLPLKHPLGKPQVAVQVPIRYKLQ